MKQQYTKEEIEKIFSKYSHPTKASHFVKREYLKQWSNDGEHVLRSINGGPFVLVASKEICTERYMYEIEKLGKNEIIFLKYMYHNAPDVVKKLNDSYLEDWQIACNITEIFNGSEFEEFVRKMKIQAGEDMQTSYESAYTAIIRNSLLNCDESFLHNEDEKLNFAIFLFSQFLRTQKQKNNLIQTYKKAQEEKPNDFQMDPESLWKVLITIMTNMASYTLLCKENTHIQFIVSDDGKLMTGDQPVINIAANKETDYVKFYYPINPNIGIIYPVDKYCILKNDQEIIERMNNEIVNNSLRFIFKK